MSAGASSCRKAESGTMSDQSISHCSPIGSPQDDAGRRLCGEHIREVKVTLEHLDAALVSTLSTNNTARVEAEGYFASLGDDPRLITALLLRLQDSTQGATLRWSAVSILGQREDIRQLAAVLLANRISGAWTKLSDAEQSAVQGTVLVCLANATSRGVLRAVATLADNVARSSLHDRPWASLLPALEQAAGSPIESHREVSMMLLGTLTESLGHHLQPYYPTLHATIVAGVRDPAITVRKAALSAVTCLARWWARALGPQDLGRLASALQTVVEVAQSAWGVGDMDTLSDALEALSSASEAAQHTIGKEEGRLGIRLEASVQGPMSVVGPITELALRAANCLELTAPVRTQAFDTLRTVGTVYATSLCAPYPPVSGGAPLCSVLVPALCALSTPTSLHSGAGAEDEDDEGSPEELARETLGALACSTLPQDQVLAPIMTHVAAAVASQDVVRLMGALRVLSAVMEGAAEGLLPRVPDLLQMVKSTLTNGEVQLLRAAATLTVEMAEHLQPELAERHLDEVLLVILHFLQTAPADEEVVVLAARAVMELCPNLTTEDLGPSLEVLVRALSDLVRWRGGDPDGRVRAAALGSLSAVASVAGDEFFPFAESNPVEVRAAATEAMGSILLAVGSSAVPQSIWEGALRTVAEGLGQPGGGVGPLREAAHRFLGRVAGALDAAFTPYLPLALPPALEALAHLGHGEEVGVGAHRRAVHTGALEEQVAAAEALGAYASATGAAFLPYLGGSLEALDAAVRNPAEPLRVAAVRSLEFMLHPVRGEAGEHVLGSASTVLGALTWCLEEEKDTDTLVAAMLSLETMFLNLGGAAHALPAWRLQRLVAAIATLRAKPATEGGRDALELASGVERLQGIVHGGLGMNGHTPVAPPAGSLHMHS